jgi:predicted Rossmann fold nucleotide-binding protein DprA/Smf involved in DNA uptake
MSQAIFYTGNQSFFELPKVAFLSSRNISSNSVLKCLDWAVEQRNEGVCVMSGFHSSLEKDVLRLLLKGIQPVVLVLGRSLYTQIPKNFQKPLDEERLLIISPVAQTIHRHSAQSALIRNRYIMRTANEIVFGSLDKKGTLYPLYKKALLEGKIVQKIS